MGSVRLPSPSNRVSAELAVRRQLLRMRMIAPGHFMNQRYYALNVPNRVEPPPAKLVK